MNILDNSINLDPAVLAQVAEMDEKAGDSGQKPKPPPIPDTDVSGFNVLLNACKPAILEARPPMKLNVVKDISKGDSIPKHASEMKQKSRANRNPGNHGLCILCSNRNPDSKPRPKFGAWYLPVKTWTIKKEQGQEGQYEKRGRVFGGIVQQKLDDIEKKRESDMKALMKENSANADVIEKLNGPTKHTIAKKKN